MHRDDLVRLRERVRAAKGPDRDLDRAVHTACGLAMNAHLHIGGLLNAYTGSLDAAVALVERVLPGWRWVLHSPRSALQFGASLSDPRRGGRIVPAEHPASATLAILDALLSALITAQSEAADVRA